MFLEVVINQSEGEDGPDCVRAAPYSIYSDKKVFFHKGEQHCFFYTHPHIKVPREDIVLQKHTYPLVE